MKRYWLLFVLLMLMVSACQQATVEPTVTMTDSPTMTATITLTATETSTPSPSATATSTEKPTKTPRPTGTITLTPTPTAPIIEVGGDPVRQGTQLPEVETITLDNIDRLEEIGRWGYGRFLDVELSEDENHVLALSPLGVIWFDARTMRESKLVEIDFRECTTELHLSPSTNFVTCLVGEEPINQYLTPKVYSINIYSAEDGSLQHTVEAEGADYAWLAPDDERLFVVEKNTRIWNLVSKQWMDEGYSRFSDMRFSQDGTSFLAFDSWDSAYYLYTSHEEPRKIPSSGTYISHEPTLQPISQDGKYVAGEWEDWGELFVKDGETGEILFTYCYDPEKCSDDSSNTSSPKLAREMNLSGSYPETYLDLLAISPDSKYLVASVQFGYDDILLYFSLPSGELIRKEDGWAKNVAFFTKSSNFLTWSSSNIRLKNIYDGTISKYVPELYSSSTTAEISPDSQVLVTGDGNRIEIYNLLDGTMANCVEIDASISDVAHFNHSTKVLAGKWWNKDEAVVWDYFTGETHTYKTDLRYYFVVDYLEVQVTADDQFIRFFIHDTSNYTFNVETGEFISEMFIGALVNPAKPEIASFGRDGIGIYTINAETLEYQLQETIDSPGCYMWHEGFSRAYLPSGEGFACTTEDEVIVFGDFGEERLVFEDPLPDSYRYLKPVYTITNDNTMLLLSHEGNIAAVYDVFSNEKVYQLSFPGTSLVQFTSDNKYLVTLGPGGIFRIYGVPFADD